MTAEIIIETNAPVVNKVIVVGRLGTVLGRNQKGRREAVTVAASRTRLGGALSRFSILLTTPFGEPYALPIEVAPTTEGADLLETLEEGAAIAVEGEARLIASFDGRYAAGETDKGRQVRDLQLSVTRVRVPATEEPEGTTAVWLTGTVVEPPRFFRHPEQPSMLLAQTLLEVYIERATSRPGYPGLRRLSRERVEVPVVVSVADAFAGLLYRPGNQVRVEGELARMIETQYGKAVTDAVAGRQAEWEAARAGAASEEQARFELRRFQRQVRQLTEQARTRVVAGYVEAAGEGATPIGEDEARSLYREFQRRRRERRSTAVARAQVEAAAAKIGQGEEAGLDAAEATTPRARPRRRGEVEVVAAATPEIETTGLAAVEGGIA